MTPTMKQPSFCSLSRNSCKIRNGGVKEIPLNESVNLFTMVDLPVFGLPIIAIIGSKLA
jgi:hypothetical protein